MTKKYNIIIIQIFCMSIKSTYILPSGSLENTYIINIFKIQKNLYL